MGGPQSPPLGTLDPCPHALCDTLVANTSLTRLSLLGVPTVALIGLLR